MSTPFDSAQGRRQVRLHRWDEIALEKVTEMISRKIITGEREMVTQIYLKRGAIVPMHSHESEQMTYVLQGGLRFLINGEEIKIGRASCRERVENSVVAGSLKKKR